MHPKKNNQMTIKMAPPYSLAVQSHPTRSYKGGDVLPPSDAHVLEGGLDSSVVNEKKIHVPKDRFTDKLRTTFKRKEGKKLESGQQTLDTSFTRVVSTTKRDKSIEDVAGRPIEEILLENYQLRNRRGDMNQQLQRLNEMIASTREVLWQLVDVEFNRNPTIARPIAEEYAILGQMREEVPIQDLATCLRKMQYYTTPDVSDWTLLQRENETLKQELKKWQMERHKGREGGDLKTADEQLQKRILKAKGVSLLVKKEQGGVENSADSPVEIANEMVPEETKQDELVTSVDGIDSNGKENSEPHPHDLNEKQEEEERMLQEITKPTYQILLDRRGYDYSPSKIPTFDVVIEKDSGDTIPLKYIDFCIERTDMFDAIVEKTNRIYFLFDSQETMRKGNMKFTSWLLKEKKKKKKRTIAFSFTTVDELKKRGLDELNSM